MNVSLILLSPQFLDKICQFLSGKDLEVGSSVEIQLAYQRGHYFA